jgi:hypothetical protein
MGSLNADEDSECTRVFVTIEHERNQTYTGELMEIRYGVGWCTSNPLDTPPARLVTADPETEMIEHDLEPLHKSEGLTSTSAADATISA